MKKLFLICLVAISFLAIAENGRTATYFIDYESGNDAQSGTSLSSPWKRAPGMKGFSGSYTHVAGDQFIFKGGVVWSSGVFPFAIANSGTQNNPDYYGVDQAWYKGNSFTRPVFNGEYANLGGGANGSIVFISSESFITIDNIEIKNLNAQSSWGPALIMVQGGASITIKNCYLHDWTMVGSKDDSHGAVIGNLNGKLIVTNCIISNSAFKNNGEAVRNATEVSYCTIFDVSSALVTVTGSVYNNTIYNMYSSLDPTYHTNLIYMIQGKGTGRIYNNVIYNIYSAGTFIYPNPCWHGDGSGKVYVYNNVIYNVKAGVPIINFDTESGVGSSCGSGYVYNNTIQSDGNIHVRITPRSGDSFGEMDIRNNHSITNNALSNTYCISTANCGNASKSNQSNNILMTKSSAEAMGYNAASSYSPTGQNCSTVGVGADLSPIFTNDINGYSRPGGAWDAGAYQYNDGYYKVGAPTGLRLK
jgi:hypothetical protein